MQQLNVQFRQSDHQDRYIELAINGSVYRYFFHDIRYAEEQWNALKRWPGRALAWVKKNSHKTQKQHQDGSWPNG